MLLLRRLLFGDGVIVVVVVMGLGRITPVIAVLVGGLRTMLFEGVRIGFCFSFAVFSVFVLGLGILWVL
jgi:hypothetical protein